MKSYSLQSSVSRQCLLLYLFIYFVWVVLYWSWTKFAYFVRSYIKFSKITNCVTLKTKQHQIKVLLNGFPMNGHTLGFCP